MSAAPKFESYVTGDHGGSTELMRLWQRDIVAYLRGMIDEWEGVDPDDKTLYTLGLRRAIDVVNGTYVHPRDLATTTKTETDDDDAADYDRRSVLPAE